MGVRVVMTGIRLAGGLTFVLVLMMHIGGLVVIVEVGWTRMGEEHHMPARAVVHNHMQSRQETGDDQTQAYNAHHRQSLVLG